MYKLKERTLLNSDIIYPEIPCATFTKALTQITVKNIVNDLNYGTEMLKAYKAHRNNLDITNVVQLLDKLDLIYKAWDLINYTNKRNAD